MVVDERGRDNNEEDRWIGQGCESSMRAVGNILKISERRIVREF